MPIYSNTPVFPDTSAVPTSSSNLSLPEGQGLAISASNQLFPISPVVVNALSSPRDVQIFLTQVGLQSLKVFQFSGGVMKPLDKEELTFTPSEKKAGLNRLKSRSNIGSISDLGNLILSDLVFQQGSYTIPGTTKKIKFGGLAMETVLIEVDVSKNIVRTPVNGRDGTVKEYIADNDDAIVIRGKLVHSGNDYPVDEVKRLLSIIRAKCPISILSEYLNNIYDITDIVIESARMAQSDGSVNEQIFEIKAYSEKSYELQLRNA